jgi:hypothetical protein
MTRTGQVWQDGGDARRGRVVPLPPPGGAGGPWSASGTGAEYPRAASVERAEGAPGPARRPRDRQRDLADRELLAKRDRLIERFAAMQLDLGGVYYEMAIRDHLREDVLTRKAAEMQRVDAELRQVEEVLQQGGSSAHKCPACDALYAPGAAFCSRCGSSLAAPTGDPGR